MTRTQPFAYDPSQIAYCTRWNRYLLQPIPTRDGEWIGEDEARRRWEEQHTGFTVVDLTRTHPSGRPQPHWTLQSASGGGGLSVLHWNTARSHTRVGFYRNVEGRLWPGQTSWWDYPDETQRYDYPDAVRRMALFLEPDGTGGIEVLDTAWSTDELILGEFDQYPDVERFWLPRPVFGDWATLVDPATGPQRNAGGYVP